MFSIVKDRELRDALLDFYRAREALSRHIQENQQSELYKRLIARLDAQYEAATKLKNNAQFTSDEADTLIDAIKASTDYTNAVFGVINSSEEQQEANLETLHDKTEALVQTGEKVQQESGRSRWHNFCIATQLLSGVAMMVIGAVTSKFGIGLGLGIAGGFLVFRGFQNAFSGSGKKDKLNQADAVKTETVEIKNLTNSMFRPQTREVSSPRKPEATHCDYKFRAV